jgi:hypothetical protein
MTNRPYAPVISRFDGLNDLLRRGLESILHVVYTESVAAREDPHDVEPHGVKGWIPVGKVLLGEGANDGLFVGGDGFQRITEAGSPAKFHFDEYKDIMLAHDQVDLSEARPVVSFDELVAAPGKVA